MGLRVLEVSYALAPPVGPDAVGGAEQVLAIVDAALAAAGHEPTLVAPAGSRAAGRLVATAPGPGPWDEAARREAERRHAEAVRGAIAAARFDLLHLHGIDFERVLPREGPPAVVTLHLPPSWYPSDALRRCGRDVTFVCVSSAQARALPGGVPVAAVIPNGVALDVYRPRGARGDFALLLARVCPEKGIAPALEAARAAGLPLVVAGQVFPYPDHVRYFEERVRPLLDRDRRFLGPVTRGEKARLLAAARCLVVPSLAPETSSLVAMEALASGTPVVARRAGALPEVVEDGRTGILVDRDDELGPAMLAASRVSGEACRRAAEARFDAAETGRRYVALLEALARGRAPARAS